MDNILSQLDSYINQNGKFPTRRDLRSVGISETFVYNRFGGMENFKNWYNSQTTQKEVKKFETTLVVPDAHVSPDQSLKRFELLNKLILDKQPDNIIFMGDFVTLESLSNWDLNRAGIMEGRRYHEDVEAGRKALELTLKSVKGVYSPKIVFLMGNHEERLSRYVETKPELSDHLNIEVDLQLKYLGVDIIIPYREYYTINGVDFTHAPMNAANQACSGKFAIHRASEMTNNSLIFAHTHRKEGVNFYRHGADDIVQVMMCGAFFEHTDSYALGSLQHYWRGCIILNHWKHGRFDVEEYSIARLKNFY
jgi:predicted MPP superfamily phosphohydrolase